MRILVVASRYDYGDPQRGESLDFYHLFLPLRSLYGDTELYDFLSRQQALGRDGMNAELTALVRDRRPDIVVVSLYTNELLPSSVAEMKKCAVTIAYLYDDAWRERYSIKWAREFDFVTTSHPHSQSRFAKAGVRNVIYSPFGFNEHIFTRRERSMRYDVSFVGLYHPYRGWLVGQLRKVGISVATFGHRWPAGRLSLAEMVETFNASKINLNLSNSSHWQPRFLLSSPLALPWMLKMGKHREQIKTRHFELAGCGAFQLSYDVAGLDDFFEVGEEIVTYRSPKDLIEKVRHYLANEDERGRIAHRAWQRAWTEHTSGHRLRALVEEATSRMTNRAHRSS